MHLENDRWPAKSTESKINLNRSVPVAESHNKPVIESGRVENSANLPVKNGEQKNSKIQKDAGKQKSVVGETSSSLGIESARSLSKKPSSSIYMPRNKILTTRIFYLDLKYFLDQITIL